MKKLSLMAVLTLSTMLTACGGSSSGGGYVPTTTLPTTDGATTPGSGTNIQTVNNTEKRTATYETAATEAGVTAGTSAEDVTKAYKNMEKILVQQDFTDATEEDILLALAMAGTDISDLKEKSLDELKAEAQDTAIKAAAEDVYAKLGTERVLSLKDITLYEPSDANRETYKFVVDSNGNLTGLKMSDESEASSITFNRVGDGKYHTNATFVNYGFKFGDCSFDCHEEEITLDHTPTEAELREAFKKTAQKEWPNASDMDAMLTWIKDVDLSNVLSSEDDCEDGNNCVYKETIASNVGIQYNSLGKDSGLKYADFGTLTWTEPGTPDEISIFYGGYEALAAKAADLPQVDTEMKFAGKAVAGVEWERGDDEGFKTFNGSSDLTFKDGKETLVTDFTGDGWHKVTVATDTSNPGDYTFTFDGTPTDSNLAAVTNAYAEKIVDINYYGENKKNPEEMAGTVSYSAEDNAGNWMQSDIVFGGVRK